MTNELEKWMPVPGFTNYMVSDLGRVLNLDTKKIHVGSVGSHKYRQTSLLDHKGQRRFFTIHKLILISHVGPSHGRVARHKDGVRSNSILSNLRWGSYQDNADDRLIHGTDCRGVKHPSAKLSEDQVRDIRSRAAEGERHHLLAKEFNVNKVTISRVVNRQRYANVN